MLWGAPDTHSPAGKSIQDLFRATTGSAGLDLSASTYTVLTPDMGMQAIPTGVYGLLPKGMVGLVLGRSSVTMKGILVAPGVIDSDYQGEIKVMTHSPLGIAVIESGQRLAQLVMLPLIHSGNNSKNQHRGAGGFGSSDVYWLQAISQQRPELELIINGKRFKGLLDTEADVSVISEGKWPSAWPKHTSMTSLQGIGQSQSPYQSSDELHWKDLEGHEGSFTPYIVKGLPISLWGRDVMSKMGVYLYSPNEQVSQQMFNQGMLPQAGLGRNGQGIQAPLQMCQKLDTKRLGYF
ncbi:LOW QUALITY PROTEIN: endogenous retrovirus group K member 7 Pro protein-like [Nannospalax galili]|uniref:LOW QUALITY PROTEIN: endogenous retrovirus group K member 7 Pro protein-like n=1 Tax=Nannospalax galili TaxID=1026970 RepID=UPI00111C5AAF|nr:LOW QUALITY PROTEIN: endogenous retrovirus group K member 7 Pro protein-like [Nannospalax galili]